MQKQIQADLYSSVNCKEFITTFSSGKHKSHHQKLSSSFVSQLLPQYMCTQPIKLLSDFFQELKKNLLQLRNSLDQKITNLDHQISKYNLIINYDLSQQASNSCLTILSNKFNKYNEIRCCNVYEIYSKIFQGNGKKIPSNLIQNKIQNIANTLQTDFNQCFKNYKVFFQKYHLNQIPLQQSNIKSKVQDNMTPKTSANSNRDPPSKRQELYDQDDEREIRPTRGQKRRIEKVETTGQKSRFKKIKELQSVSQNQRFDIRFKILKVIKTFKIRNQTKALLNVGDQTGTANCVVDMRQIIKNNTTIQITECRLYNFKDLQNQIQQTKKSTISSVADIKQVNTRYTFGRLRRQNQQKRQIRPHRQRRIEVENSRNDRKSQTSEKKQQKQEEEVDNCQYYLDEQQVDSQHEQIIQSSKDYGNGYTKISEIQPALEGIDILAQIFKINDEEGEGILCTLGDQTGIVKALLPKSLSFIKKGHAIKLSDVDAQVVDQHIQIRTGKKSHIQQVRIVFSSIKVDKDISAQSWVAQDQNQTD